VSPPNVCNNQIPFFRLGCVAPCSPIESQLTLRRLASVNYRRLIIVVNPASGSRQASRVVMEAKPQLESGDTKVVIRETRSRGDAMEIARGVEPGHNDVFVAVGGDGTVHEVINGVMLREDGRRPPIGVVPAGTGNSVAQDLDVRSTGDAVARIACGKTVELDLMRLGIGERDLCAFNIVGWGLTALARATAERLRWLGAWRCRLASVVEIRRQRYLPVRVVVDGQVLCGQLPFVLSSNTQHTARGLKIAPAARFDDGLVDFLVVKPASRYALLRLLRSIGSGNHVSSPLVQQYRCREFLIESGEAALLNVDGELIRTTRVEAIVRAAALRLIA